MFATLKLADEVSQSTATSQTVFCHPSPNMSAAKILKLYIKENALPRVLQDWDEVERFMKQHLVPTKKSPSGAPVYNAREIAALLKRENVRFPD